MCVLLCNIFLLIFKAVNLHFFSLAPVEERLDNVNKVKTKIMNDCCRSPSNDKQTQPDDDDDNNDIGANLFPPHSPGKKQIRLLSISLPKICRVKALSNSYMKLIHTMI